MAKKSSKAPAKSTDFVQQAVHRAREWKLIDLNWYNSTYGARHADQSAVMDELMSEHGRERNPNPLFDSNYYAALYGSAIGDASPFLHYVSEGVEKSLRPHPLIDPSWVTLQLQNLGLSGPILSALLHKCSALNLDPHPLFSTRFYLKRYSELASRRVHPIIHFIRHGSRERRAPHPLFWAKWIIETQQLPDTTDDILMHYIHDQSSYSILPNPYFDGEWYRQRYSDVAESNVNPLYHYLRYGRFESRLPSKNFDPEWVNEKYRRSIEFSGCDPLSFFILRANGHIGPNKKYHRLEIERGMERSLAERHRSDIVPQRFAEHRSRRRILFVSHNLRMQGAQTSLFELACETARNSSYDVAVLAPDDGPMKSQYLANGVQVHKYRLPVSGLESQSAYDGLVEEFRKQIVDLAPDLVHGNTTQSYHALALACQAGIATIWNIRESEDPDTHPLTLQQGAKALYEQALQQVSKFVFVSAATKQLWTDRYPSIDSVVIRNGINHDNFVRSHRSLNRQLCRAIFNLSQSDIAILNIGTWTDRKGQRDLIQAMPLLGRRLWSGVKLIMVGANQSPYGELVASDILALPRALRERVTLVQETNALDRISTLQAYAAADVFVLTSRLESYPRVIIEAMWSGLPIIAGPCFGVKEQIKPGKTGEFYEMGDVANLADKIEELVVNPRARILLGGAAKWSAENELTQFAGMVREYHAAYESSIAGR